MQSQIAVKNKTRTARVTPGGSSDKLEAMTAEQVDLCQKIEQFFTAMKLLQRAVNRKEDISDLKTDFETKQKTLQKMGKSIQLKLSQQSQEEKKSSSQRNRSSSYRNAQSSTMTKQYSNRNISSPMGSGSIRPKSSNKAGGNVSPKPSTGSKSSQREQTNQVDQALLRDYKAALDQIHISANMRPEQLVNLISSLKQSLEKREPIGMMSAS